MASTLEPNSETELASMVGEAASTGRPLEIAGGGTRRLMVSGAETQLSTRKLSGITLYEPAALTISAKAGTPLAAVTAALAAEGQHLPFEPSDWRALLATHGEPTIGGMVSAAAAGPRRIQAGSVRDSAIGVRFVDGEGTIIKNGGRVMKNVTGYDLVKLMCGAWGTLGILSEVTFKVLPKPETIATLILQGLSPEKAVEAMSLALCSPFDVNGAAHLGNGEEARTLMRLEGFEASVRYRADKLAMQLADFGSVQVQLDETENTGIWKSVRDVESFAGKAGSVWRVSVRPSSAQALIMAVSQTLEIETLMDWGGGLLWLRAFESDDRIAGKAIQTATQKLGGSALLVRPTGSPQESVSAFKPQSAAIGMLSQQLRRQFDPKGIFNRGWMGFNVAA